MKKYIVLIVGFVFALVVFAVDEIPSTLRPQKYANQVEFAAQQTEALYQLTTVLSPSTVATMGSLNVVIADAAVPIALGTSATTFKTITFTAQSAAQTDNTSTVFIQISAANTSLSIPLTVGGSVTWTAPVGNIFTAAQFWIDGAVGNGVVAIWTK